MAKNDAKWEALLRQAMEAARYAALEQYEKLVAAGPAYDVRNADLITGAAYGPSLGTMLDLCGFAGVKIRPAKLGWTLGLTDSQSSPKRQARNQPRFSLIGGG